MRLTEARCYVLVKLVADGKLTIERNGAQEPSIRGFYAVGGEVRPFSEKRLLAAVQDLHNEGYIRFAERGLHGVYKGLAELTDIGQLNLPTARAKLDRFAEQAAQQRREREALAAQQQREREEFAHEQAQAQAERKDFAAQKVAAAERVREFLNRHAERNIAEKDIIFRVDDHVLHAGDLALLCDAVAGQR